MKRAACIVLWTIGSFVTAAFCIGFGVGMLFYFFAATANKSDAVREVMMVVGMIVPILVAGLFLFLGITGRLPGTRPPVPPHASS